MVIILEFGWNSKFWLKFKNLVKIQKFGQNSKIWTKFRNLAKILKIGQNSENSTKLRNLRKVQNFAQRPGICAELSNLRNVQISVQSSEICAMKKCFSLGILRSLIPHTQVVSKFLSFGWKTFWITADNFLGTLYGLTNSWKQTEMFYKQYLSLSLVKSNELR